MNVCCLFDLKSISVGLILFFLIFNGNQRYKCISLGHELAYFAFVSMILLLDFDYSDSVENGCI